MCKKISPLYLCTADDFPKKDRSFIRGLTFQCYIFKFFKNYKSKRIIVMSIELKEPLKSGLQNITSDE